MSIVVQCPHCETKFTLQAEMAGKAMRCPNIDCRQVFTAKASAKPTEPPPPSVVPPARKPAAAPLPPDSSFPFPLSLELPPEPGPTPAPTAHAKPKKLAVTKPAVVEAKIVEAAIVSPRGGPKVKEVVWSAGTDVPPPPTPKKPLRAAEVEEEETLIKRRKKKKNRRPAILIVMSVAIVSLIGFAVIYVLRQGDKAEALLAAQADEAYKKGEFAPAAKSFEKLVSEYPEGDNAPKYKFFADLASMRLAVGAVTNRENPDSAVERIKKFIETNKDSPFAKPKSGFGRDIHEAGKKVGEDIAAHADDRVKAYKADRAKSGELDRAEKAIALGRALLPILDPFQGDDFPLESISRALTETEKQVKHERDRTAAIKKAQATLEKLNDAAIQLAENDLTAAGFRTDSEADALIAAARGKLRSQVKYEDDPANPRAAPASAAATLLFVSSVGPTRRPPATGVGENVPPSIFLAVARGILYAIEEDTGTLVWAVRVGPEITDPPTVVRLDLDDGPTDMAIVTSNTGGIPAVAGYVLKTGVARWYQELPAPTAGPAAVVGTRAYVGVRDADGSIYEFDLTSGVRRGRIRLWQPIGPAPVVRPGTGLLYAAADSRRVYVIDAGAKDDDGTLQPLRCVGAIATNHPTGTLRTQPLLIGPDGDTVGERWMVLTQSDGPATTRLRAFKLQPLQPLTADGKEELERPAAELVLPGWVWFPPATDGERLALVTDAGQCRMFGINQPGNFDRALFPLHSPALPFPTTGTAVPGLVLPADESTFWILSNGTLQKYRLGLIPARGLELTPTGPKTQLGVPVQPAQINNRKDAACLVVRSPNSAGCKAVLINLRDGEMRWQRQLGVVPVTAPIPQDGSLVLAAEDGGIVVVPGTGGATAGRTTVAPDIWGIATAPENVTAPTSVAISADGKVAFTVTQIITGEENKPLAKYLIRRIEGGRKVHEGTVTAPATVAGTPVVLGDSLLIPAADGFVYRHVAGTGKANPDTLTAGPPWAGNTRGADTCLLTVLSETAFLTNDGGKKLVAWDWPKAGQWRPTTGGWELRERPAGAAVLLPPAAPGEAPRLMIADAAGSVWLYPSDRGGPHLRRWRPDPGTGLPTGKPSSPFVVQTDATGRSVVAYTVENKFLVCLDPERDLPRWAVRAGEEADAILVGPPQPAGAGRWLTADLGGRVTVFAADGKKSAVLSVGVPGAVPATAAGSIGGTGLLAPLSDGSAVVLSLPEGPAVAPVPRPKE